MNSKHVIESLKKMVALRQPVMLHGAPGVGKSDMVRQVASELGIDLLDFRLSQVDPVDLRGVPSVTIDGRTTWNIPDVFPTGGEGILFLDEINLAPQSVQSAAYQLVLDRALGSYELPHGWAVVAAGNRQSDYAGVSQMSVPLRNRFFHINVHTDIDSWSKWAASHGVSPLVIGFLQFAPQYLNEFHTTGTKEDEKRIQNIKLKQTFATPRSWDMLNKAMKSWNDMPLEVVEGFVGAEAAVQFMAYKIAHDGILDINDIMSGNCKTFPNEPSIGYALTK